MEAPHMAHVSGTARHRPLPQLETPDQVTHAIWDSASGPVTETSFVR